MATFAPTTWDPNSKGAYITLSNGNKTALSASDSVRTMFSANWGKWYLEYTFASGSEQFIGVGSELFDVQGVVGASQHSWGLYRASGQILSEGTELGTITAGGTTIGLLIDADTKKMQVRRDGAIVGPEITLAGERFYAAFGNGGRCTINCGATAFAHEAPAGYFAGFGARSFVFSGNTKDDAGVNAARKVRAYRRLNGALAGETVSNGTTGNYTLTGPFEGEHTLVFLDDDAGTVYNALVLDRVTGV